MEILNVNTSQEINSRRSPVLYLKFVGCVIDNKTTQVIKSRHAGPLLKIGFEWEKNQEQGQSRKSKRICIFTGELGSGVKGWESTALESGFSSPKHFSSLSSWPCIIQPHPTTN